jgi:hypothetical protein
LSGWPGVALERRTGLETRFDGSTNVTDIGVRQHAVVSPGRFRLVAGVSAEGISTDEGVFVRLTAAENPANLPSGPSSSGQDRRP